MIDSGQLVLDIDAGDSPNEALDEIVFVANRKLEAELYAPVLAGLREWWVPQSELSEHILEVTANQGRRNTGGLWTRPDIVCIGSTCFPYLPGRSFDLSTFEIKKALNEAIGGVYESAAHSAFAHRSYLIVQAKDHSPLDENFDRVKSECRRLGIGLITFKSAEDPQSYDSVVEAIFRSPNPAQINRFIASQVSDESRQRLLTMFR